MSRLRRTIDSALIGAGCAVAAAGFSLSDPRLMGFGIGVVIVGATRIARLDE